MSVEYVGLGITPMNCVPRSLDTPVDSDRASARVPTTADPPIVPESLTSLNRPMNGPRASGGAMSIDIAMINPLHGD